MSGQSNRAFRDISVLIPPGGSVQVRAPGDFIFLKFSDRPIRCIVDGNPVTYEVGDRSRFPQPFDWFEAANPDPNNPAQVIFVVGFGDYDRKIIQGEISVIPGVRGADGAWRDDTRYEITATVEPLDDSGRAYFRAEPVYLTGRLGMSASGGYVVDGGAGPVVITRASVDSTRFCYISSREENNLSVHDDARQNVTWFQKIIIAGEEYHLNGSPNDIAFWRGRFVGLIAGTRSGAVRRPSCIVPPTMGESSVSAIVNLGRATESRYPVSLCTGPGGGLYILLSSGEVLLGDEVIGKLPSDIPANASTKLRYDKGEREFYIAGNNGRLWRLSERFEELEYVPYEAHLRAGDWGVHVENGLVWGFSGSPIASAVAGAYPLRDFSTPITLHVSVLARGCAAVDNLTWRLSAAPRITADVFASRVGNRVRIGGEVIRAILQAGTSRAIRDSYLDHIFSFEYSGPEVGAPPERRHSGGVSFAAAGIDDDFVVMLPATVKMIVDDGLTGG